MNAGFGTLVRSLILATVLVGLSGPLSAAPVQEDPLDRQVLDISKDLRCAVCQNQPVSESNADLAKDMRRMIREQLLAGKSRDEIMNYFVARYGDFVLLKPPTERAGLALWLAPPLVLGVMLLSGWLFLRRRGRNPPPVPPALTDQDLARVKAAREQLDNSRS